MILKLKFLSKKLNVSGLKCRYQTICSCEATVKPALVVHGGAEYIPDIYKQVKLNGVKLACSTGYRVLIQTGCVLNAVEAAINVMENNEAFNAGKGAALTLDGKVEMDAQINEGETFSSGSVALARNIAHPISLARMVMEKSPHAIIGGDGVEEFITKMCFPRVTDDYLITEASKSALEKFKKHSLNSKDPKIVEFEEPVSGDTVGCVAVDTSGHVASGTSTGGLTGKYRGRIGDSPLPGSGGYSDDEVGAISVSGHGELILQYNFAHRVLSLMKQGKSGRDAAATACEHMAKRMKKTIMAGAITVSNKGEIGIFFSTKHMPWAYQATTGLHYGINQGEDICEERYCLLNE